MYKILFAKFYFSLLCLLIASTLVGGVDKVAIPEEKDAVEFVQWERLSGMELYQEKKSDSIVANFEADDTLVFAGGVVQFANLSTGNPTYFEWAFPGATPAISYQSSPQVMYHTPGVYDVTLYIASLNGTNALTKTGYIEVLPEPGELPPGWDYSTTTSQHAFVLSVDMNPRIFEIPINPGDFIGAFCLDFTGVPICAGAVEWDDTSSVVVAVQGDDWITPQKDGFAPGEEIKWILYSVDQEEEYPASALYDPNLPMQQYFIPSGISGLTDLHAGTVKEIVFDAGWIGVSSPVLPWENEMEQVFSSIVSDVEIVLGEDGVYWPEGGVNSLEFWGNNGYVIKMKADAELNFEGYASDNLSCSFQEGWNILPVPTNCEVDISTLVLEYSNEIVAIKEIAGLKMYWPQYAVFSLLGLSPGKAYLLKTSTDFTLEFPACP